MNYILLVCVDAAWGYTRKNQLPWHLPEEMAHYHRIISKQPEKKRAFIIGKNTWLSASDVDKKIMTESLCCLISKTYRPSSSEKIIQFATLAKARQFLEDPMHLIDRVYIVGGKDLYIESLQSNMVTTLIISKLRALFDCDRFLLEIKDFLTARFFCSSQTYCTYTDSVDFIIEEWIASPPKSTLLSHLAYGLEFSLQLHYEIFQQKIPYESLAMVLKFIIDSIHQYCNPYFPQPTVFQIIATNILKLFKYFFTPEHIYSVQVKLNGCAIHQHFSSKIIERQEYKDWGWVDVLYENNFLNTTVLCVEKHKSIQKNYHDTMLEHELFMSGAIHTYYEQGPLLSIAPLVEFERSFNMVYGYLNTAQNPAKIISLNDRIFDMKYEISSIDNCLPKSLEPSKLNCLMVGTMEGIGRVLYDEIKASYNLICLDKSKADDGRFYIPFDCNNLESIFQIRNALAQLKIDIIIITSSAYSCPLRREQPSHIFEETIQLNYLGPIFLLLELMNHHLLDRHTKIMVLSPSQHAHDCRCCLTSCSPDISPEALFKEPENYNPDRQHAISRFAITSAIYYLFQQGYNIMGINSGYFPNTPLVSNQPDLPKTSKLNAAVEQIIALLKKENFETFYEDVQAHGPVSEAVLKYDSAKLWDYSRSLYFKIAHLPQKMRINLFRPITLWTWNILGIKTDNKALNLNKRMNYLLQKIYYEQPDVICLQEITQAIWNEYLKPFSDKHGYRLSLMPADIADSPDKVFVATLSRLFYSQEELIELEKDKSGKDYYCLYQRYEQFELINVHLLSGVGNEAKRMAQMKQILSSVEIHNNCIILGDFNSDLNQTDISLSDHAFLDVWNVIHPRQKGDTEDFEHNLLRKQLKIHDTNTQSRRVDGIFVHKELMHEVLSVERLGLEEVLSKQFISDHYGLTCMLEFKSKPNSSERKPI